MTADAFADLLRARSAGRRRWMARCPAHSDRNPSLGISEAPGGAILLRCHRGCATDAILRAMKLQWRDLYTGAYPSRAQRGAIQESRESKQRAGLLFREAAVDLHLLESTVNHLGAELARTPDDHPAGARRTAQFHATCAALAKATCLFEFHQQQRKNAAL
jgi:hypothetical protein